VIARPRPVPPTVVHIAWIGAGERVEHVGGVVRGDAGILVADRQHTQLPGQVVLGRGRGWRRQRPARAESA
jgi:hypothetical protein